MMRHAFASDRLQPRYALVLALVVLTLTSLLTPASTWANDTLAEPAPLLLILDASGSMWGQVDGENKIVTARRALGELVDDLPAASQVGVVAYGHREKGDCADIETLIPLGPVDAAAVKSTINDINPKGKTPITASVEHALEVLKQADTQATMVLLSDGLETCGGDPCKAVRLAREQGMPFVFHVVGFDVEGEDLSQLQCMAQAGGGLFLSAEDGDQLTSALDNVMALPVDVPAGRLSLEAVADGQLHDVSVRVAAKDTGEEVAVSRTYSTEETNPAFIPLPDGVYDVKVKAIGLKGDIRRHFEITIQDGATVERQVDFSTGELSITVDRNGQPDDVTYRVYTLDGEQVAVGRTREKTDTQRLTSGRYEVRIKAIQVKGAEQVSLGEVEVPPTGHVEVHQAVESGTLKIGAKQRDAASGADLVDATVHVYWADGSGSVAQGRTYQDSKSNPKTFELFPGRYLVKFKALSIEGKPRQEVEVEVTAGGVTERMVEF